MKKEKITRAERVGRLLAKVIGELAHLMYQNNTSLNFIRGVKYGIEKIYAKRLKAKGN
jgi:hypothetical protein